MAKLCVSIPAPAALAVVSRTIPLSLVERYHCYIKTLVVREYGKVMCVYSRPSGLSAGASVVRVALVFHAGLIVVVLVNARRVVAACEREDPLCRARCDVMLGSLVPSGTIP